MINDASKLVMQLMAEVPLLEWEVLLYDKFDEPGFTVGAMAVIGGHKIAVTNRFDDHLLVPKDKNELQFIIQRMLALLMDAIRAWDINKQPERSW